VLANPSAVAAALRMAWSELALAGAEKELLPPPQPAKAAVAAVTAALSPMIRSSDLRVTTLLDGEIISELFILFSLQCSDEAQRWFDGLRDHHNSESSHENVFDNTLIEILGKKFYVS
jgi:hypothetical protein